MRDLPPLLSFFAFPLAAMCVPVCMGNVDFCLRVSAMIGCQRGDRLISARILVGVTSTGRWACRTRLFMDNKPARVGGFCLAYGYVGDISLPATHGTGDTPCSQVLREKKNPSAR